MQATHDWMERDGVGSKESGANEHARQHDALEGTNRAAKLIAKLSALGPHGLVSRLLQGPRREEHQHHQDPECETLLRAFGHHRLQ